MKQFLAVGIISATGLLGQIVPAEFKDVPIASAAIGAILYLHTVNMKTLKELQDRHAQQLDTSNARYAELVLKLVK